jgi:hypothetical protein
LIFSSLFPNSLPYDVREDLADALVYSFIERFHGELVLRVSSPDEEFAQIPYTYMLQTPTLFTTPFLDFSNHSKLLDERIQNLSVKSLETCLEAMKLFNHLTK